MNRTIIEQLNKGVYAEGCVYWDFNKGWTSRLWQKLYNLGWRSVRSPAGFKSFRDNKGKTIETGHLSWPYALNFLAKLMR